MRIKDIKNKLLTVEEIRAELSLRFERLNEGSTQNEYSKELVEHALFSCKLKGKYRNFGHISHKLFQSKIVQARMIEIKVIQMEESIAIILANRDMSDGTTSI
jgi:hypothetical protein